MTPLEIGKIEGVSTRTAQRYITQGFAGHKLPAVRLGQGYSVDPKAYAAWRILCGWDKAQPAPRPAPKVVQVEVAAQPIAVPARPAPAPTFRPWPLCADPNGVITNCPHEHSCSHPHPLAVKAHEEAEARALRMKYRGDPDEY